jgi:hypothetical protein
MEVEHGDADAPDAHSRLADLFGEEMIGGPPVPAAASPIAAELQAYHPSQVPVCAAGSRARQGPGEAGAPHRRSTAVVEGAPGQISARGQTRAPLLVPGRHLGSRGAHLL